jgi:solute carrier family 35 (UDP-galactose transporter), member B1
MSSVSAFPMWTLKGVHSHPFFGYTPFQQQHHRRSLSSLFCSLKGTILTLVFVSILAPHVIRVPPPQSSSVCDHQKNNLCQETDSVVTVAALEPKETSNRKNNNQSNHNHKNNHHHHEQSRNLPVSPSILSRMKRAAAAAATVAPTLDQQHQSQQNNGHQHNDAFNNGLLDDHDGATGGATSSDAAAMISSSPPASTTTTSESSTSRNKPGLDRLFVCAMGICVCYLYYGILQERLFSGHHDGQRRQPRLGATFVLVTQCIANVFVARFWQYLQENVVLTSSRQKEKKNPDNNGNDKTKENFGLHHSLLLLTSGCYVAAMVCSNEAIQYVSYPVAVLAKSCKLIPSMIVGQVVEGRGTYSQREWIAALLISAGIVLFHSHRLFFLQQQQQQQQQQHKNVLYENDDKDSGGHLYGMILLLISLAMDGLLSSCQNFLKRSKPADDTTSKSNKSNNNNNRISSQYRPPNAVETMLYINLYALIFLIPLAMVAGQWNEGIHRLFLQSWSSSSNSNNVLVGRDLCWALLLLNGTVAIGQIFIFLTIHWYTPLVTTTITTTRKFFTILLSVLTFGHEFTTTQWTAVVLVFCGLYLSIFSNTNTSSTSSTTTTTQSSTTRTISAARIGTTRDDVSGLYKKTK